MYHVEFLPSARDDLAEIARYIGHELNNPDAANRFAEDVIAFAEKTAEFSYANPPHFPIRPLKHEYRRGRVKNYYLFYWVDEKEKSVTFARVLYAWRNLERELS